jgi:hypothetical protein
MSDSRQSFGFDIGFIDHLRIITASNYKSHGITVSKYYYNYSTHKVSPSQPDF